MKNISILILILGLAITNTTHASIGEACESANFIETDSNAISVSFSAGDSIYYLEFIATYKNLEFYINNGIPDTSLGINYIYLYQKLNSCDSLKLIKFSKIEKDSSLIFFNYFNNLEVDNEYSLRIKRKNSNSNSTGFNVKLNKSLSNCPIDYNLPCYELAKNGAFDNFKKHPNSWNGSNFSGEIHDPFNNNLVCNWNSPEGTPQVVDDNGDYAVKMWTWALYNPPSSSNLSHNSESIAQDIHFQQGRTYSISFDLRKNNNNTLPETFFVRLFKNSTLLNNSNPYYATPYLQAGVVSKSSLDLMGNWTTHTFCVYSNDDYDKIVLFPQDVAFSPQDWIEIDNLSVIDVADAGPDIFSCNTSTIGPECTIPGATYSWLPSAGLNNSTIANPTVSVSQITTYVVTVTLPNGCTGTDEVIVTPGGVPGTITIPDGSNEQWFKQNNHINYIVGYTPGVSQGIQPPINLAIVKHKDFFVENRLVIRNTYINHNGAQWKLVFDSCNFYMNEGAKVQVRNGAEFYIVNSSFQACNPEKRWNHIHLQRNTGANIISRYNLFKDAENAIITDGCEFNISDCTFKNNNRALQVNSGIFVNYSSFHSNTIETTVPLYSTTGSYYPEFGVKVISATVSDPLNIGLSFIGNTFKGSGGTFYAFESDIMLIQNIFEEFNNESILAGEPEVSEIAYKHMGKSNMVNPNTVFINQNLFLNNKVSIDTRKNAEYEITFNKVNKNGMGNIENGIWLSQFFVSRNNDLQIDFNNNEIYNVFEGINALNTVDINIQDNLIDLEHFIGIGPAPTNNRYSTAISLDNSNVTLTPGGSEININGNTIKHSKVGIFTSFAKATISNNVIENMNNNFTAVSPCGLLANPCPPPAAFGIRAMNEEVTVLENKIVNNSGNYSTQPSTQTEVIGISLENTLGTGNAKELGCNNVENTGIGLRFAGDQGSNMDIHHNKMKDHTRGFVLSNNGFIGDVGSDGTANDNEWLGAYSGSETFADNSNGSQVTLYVQNGGSYDPAIDLGFDYTGSGSSSALDKDNTGNIGYTANCTNPQLIRNGSNQAQSTYQRNKSNGVNRSRSISQGKLPHMVHAADSMWGLQKQLLYAHISRDSAMASQKSWKHFLDSMKQSPMGIRLGRSLNASSTSTNMDQKLLQVNALIADYERDSTLSKGAMRQLRSIAELCPYYDGIAVYYARSLWKELGGYMLTNDCEKVGGNSGNSNSRAFIRTKVFEADQKAFSIFPNPTKGNVQINYLIESEQSVSIQFYDVIGKLATERKLSENSIHNLNLTELQQGIYFYRLLQGGDVKEHGKLIIK
tara:strand:- start:4127 stop:8047 length:3921 start_codon:yes stop_codon:yes gene_type:complete